MGFLYLIVGLVSAAFAQVLYKLFVSHGRRRFHILVTIGLFVIAQLGFFMALTELPIGVVYMSTAVIQLIVLANSHLLLNETVGRDHLVAVGLIVVGLGLYTL